MVTKDNIEELLRLLKFSREGDIFTKFYPKAQNPLKVDIRLQRIYYAETGITVGRKTTSNFSEPENFVVLECVDRLLTKEYQPEHIELEPEWKLGHSAKSGYADIWIRTYKDNAILGSSELYKDSLLIIECKTKGHEFDNAWEDTKEDGAQLFSYFQQERSTKFLCLYTSDIINGSVTPDYYLVNVQDNEDLLTNSPNLISYKDASNNRQLFNVWRETYKLDYATKGLFEKEIQAYKIGKNKYTVDDLKEVDNDSIQKKYHEFASILRQHNISGRENAFDKLVNLFLAKVVDETNNSLDLNFYWKGAAYDDDFQLQDRLQRLYRDGMKKFLAEDVTYIENKEIEKAFRRFKNDPDATKKTILGYFRALKYFSDNDFSFISIHNEKLFRQNAEVLRKMVKMLQDIRLKTDEVNQNQFLGDLFEGFLNKGIKQSEGQFFSPMPIVRFIVSALPLEQIIRDSSEVPWAIDYACGSGHFLTEYAVRIKEFVEKYHTGISIKDYYAHITGIEKEYRLSKVSKVSAFMYGHDDINIVYADALISHPDVHEGKYNVLVANPPFAVSGFLDTLSNTDRQNFRLYDKSINVEKNNAIETFFMERAAQLMQTDGVAGIILPVSILNKSGIYTRAREIIFEDFDIIALVEFSSGTFGKTGTNTVALFMRRKERNTSDAEHYRYRVDSWFNQHHNGDIIYEDEHLLAAYCNHCGFTLENYRAFLAGELTETFMQTDTLQTYHSAFFGNQRNAMKDVCNKAKSIRAKYISRVKTKAFKNLAEEKREFEKANAFLNFILAIEKEKVYYFIMAQMLSTPILIVKAPSGNVENKKFLGYEWSDTKGNEGIKYLNVEKQKNESEEDGNEEDDDTIKQIRGINGINTPLFNPQNFFDENKINTLIRKNFLGEDFSIPEELSQYVTMGRLVDMIDFSRTAFNKEIKTSITMKLAVQSKYETLQLRKFCISINPSKEEFKDIDKNTLVSFVDMSSLGFGYIENKENKTIKELENGGYTNFKENDVIIAKITPCMENGKCALAEGLTNGLGLGSTEFHILRTANRIQAKYLLEYLNREEIRIVAASNMTGSSGHRRVPAYFYEQLPIPDVPVSIMEKIVSECEVEDAGYQQYYTRVEEIKTEMEKLMSEAQKNANIPLKLSKTNIFNISIGRRVLKDEIVNNGKYDIFSANVFEPFGKSNHSILDDFSMPSVLWGIDGDWMVNYREKNKLFHPTDHCGVIRIKDESMILPKYLVYPLLKAGEFEHFSRANRASTERIRSLTILVPKIDIQEKVVKQIFILENEITELKAKMDCTALRKAAILDKYLK